MWLLFATITVLLWGTSETIFKKVSTIEKHSVLKLISCNGLMLGVCALIFMFITRTEMNFDIILTYLPISLIYIASMFCTYKAMTLVKVSILSPLQNSSCAITTILCILILKQQISVVQIIAIIAIIICMVLLSINKDEVLRIESGNKEEDEKNAKRAYMLYLKGIFFALGYWFLDGIGSFMDDYTLEANLSAEQVIIAFSFIYCFVGIITAIVLKIKERDYKFVEVNSKKNMLKWLGTLIETAGQYTYIYAFAFGDAVLASPYIAAYSVVTVILSRIFLKEKLKKKQYALISLILIAMITLSF